MGYEPLHHKYRPQTFAQLVGQSAIATTLSNALKQQRIAPAYLFCGPRGTGKTSSARILAKSLNCSHGEVPTDEPCGVCATCTGITDGSSLDVIEIDAASNTGVDNIRELIERAQFAPVQCRYKVYIIDEVHMLSTAAFNALLKTLEEPPDRVVFVLATTDPQRVLPTIISRCQRFDFRRIALVEMVTHLGTIAQKEAIAIADEALQLVAQVSQGGLRDAESLLDQLSLVDGQITIDHVWDLVGAVPERDLLALVKAIASDNSVAVLDCARHLMDRGREPLIVLQNLAGFYRDLLIAKTAGDRQDLVSITPPTWKDVCAFVQTIDMATLLLGQQHLRTSEVQVKNTTQPRLWLEVTLLGLLPSTLHPTLSATVSTPGPPATPLKALPLPVIPALSPTLPVPPQVVPAQSSIPQATVHQSITTQPIDSQSITTQPIDSQTTTTQPLFSSSPVNPATPPPLTQSVTASQTAIASPRSALPSPSSSQNYQSSSSASGFPTVSPVPPTISPSSPISSATPTVSPTSPAVSSKASSPKVQVLSYSPEQLQDLWQQVTARIKPPIAQTLFQQQGRLIAFDGAIAKVAIKSKQLMRLAEQRIEKLTIAFSQVLDHPVRVTMEIAAPPSFIAPPPVSTAPPSTSIAPSSTIPVPHSPQVPSVAPTSQLSALPANQPARIQPNHFSSNNAVSFIPQGAESNSSHSAYAPSSSSLSVPSTVHESSTNPVSSQPSTTNLQSPILESTLLPIHNEDAETQAVKRFASMFNGEIVELDEQDLELLPPIRDPLSSLSNNGSLTGSSSDEQLGDRAQNPSPLAEGQLSPSVSPRSYNPDIPF